MTITEDNRGKPANTFVFDPYAGLSKEQARERCRQLARAVVEWQTIAMVLAVHGFDALTPEDAFKLNSLIESYKD